MIVGDVTFSWKPSDSNNADEAGPYYQGDIYGPRPMSKNGKVDERFRWPNGIVPYEIARGDFGERHFAILNLNN